MVTIWNKENCSCLVVLNRAEQSRERVIYMFQQKKKKLGIQFSYYSCLQWKQFVGLRNEHCFHINLCSIIVFETSPCINNCIW
jgi:hypothetical protein